MALSRARHSRPRRKCQHCRLQYSISRSNLMAIDRFHCHATKKKWETVLTRELEYGRINISSNTWNGYTAENQEERLFFNETAFPFWCHALWKLGSSNCCIFEMKHATGMETCTKIYFLRDITLHASPFYILNQILFIGFMFYLFHKGYLS